VSNSQSPRELSFAEFVETYVRRIAQLPGSDKVAFDPVDRVIRFEYRGRIHVAQPQIAYAEYKKDISRLDALLDVHINGIQLMQAEIPSSFAAVAPSLMPMVRDHRYLDLALLMARVSGPRVLESSEVTAFPCREIAGELVLTLVRDSADSTLVVGERDLKQWGVSFDQACEVAMKNLRARTQLQMEELAPGLYGSKWHDTYDATRLLLTELLRKLPLRGDLVVTAPTRTHLLVAGSDDPPALAAMTRIAAQLLESDPKPLSADVLQFSSNRWTESRLHSAPDLVNARSKLSYRDYTQQKDLLDKLHQGTGTDLFVATYRLAKAGDNGESLLNITQLTEGVVTLLPEADYLMLWTRAQEALIVTWTDAAAVMGGMLKKLNMYPPRYLAETFPDSQQLVALRTKVVKFAKAGRPQPPQESAQTVSPAQDSTAVDRLAARAPEMAEVFRKAVRDRFKVELGYDLEGVRWLDAYVERLHEGKVEIADNQVEAVGAFLGECFIRNLGGTWSLHDNMEMVRFNASNGIFPFNKVRKHWSNGRQGGDSLLGMYEAVIAMQPRKTGPHRIPTQEPVREMEQVLATLRQRYRALQQKPTRRTFEMMGAPNPSWLKPTDSLSEIGKVQLRLLAEGEIFWAALVQANELLFKPGTADCPGLLVYSTDHHFDSRPHELRAIASRIFELKGSAPADPQLQEIARLVTDEMDRSMGWKVPEGLTEKDVRTAAFLVFRQHIPGGVLTASQFPVLVHPSTQAVMIVPFETWPSELIRSWQPQTQGRTLEEIRRLPEGLRVTHTPNPVAAVMTQDKNLPFAWEYNTTVEALNAELNIVEFGCFNSSNGKDWRFANMGGQPFSTQQFAEWYSCADGVLEPGKSATDPKNWDRGKVLRSLRCIWYYIGKDPEGKLFRGEAEIEQRGTLVPPHSTAPATKSSGGLAAVARVFGKAGADSLLRFDGVYRVKAQPKNDADSKYCYLRFYPDKIALYTTCAENPSELTKSFNVRSGNVPQGNYKLSGDTIRIEFRAADTTLVFSGKVDKNRLVLESKRFTNSPAVRDEFLFMGWRP
jgi:hypothetical protein